MPFPQKVAEDALVACGRRCCLCHKFCRTDIEIHHIVEEANGGPNDLDNAIPLCYECHADMGKKDPHHPKGRGYTPNEIKRLRNHWYELVKSGISEQEPEKVATDGVVSKYKELLLEASFVLDYYANVYTDIVEDVDERHEKASDALRRIGVKIKAFAVVERPACMEKLKTAAGLFIGLSNSLYVYKGGDYDRLLDDNLKREDQIRDLLGFCK